MKKMLEARIKKNKMFAKKKKKKKKVIDTGEN